MSFQRAEAFALGGVMLALRGSNVQMRRPSWNNPNFWSRCLTHQLARPLPSGSPMQTFLEIKGLYNYVAIIDKLVMTVAGATAGSGVRFQILADGSPVPFTNYPSGVELNKDAPTVYPVIPRPWYLPVLEGQTIQIQAENLGPFQRIILVGAYGWYYSTVDATTTGADNGVTDAAYTPLTGGPR